MKIKIKRKKKKNKLRQKKKKNKATEEEEINGKKKIIRKVKEKMAITINVKTKLLNQSIPQKIRIKIKKYKVYHHPLKNPQK